MDELSQAWRVQDALPANGAPGWTLWRGRRIVAQGLPACRARAAQWDPIGGELIGRPDSPRLATPVEIGELQADFRASFLRRLQRFLWLHAALAACLLAAWAAGVRSTLPFAPLGAIFATLAIVCAWDRATYARSEAALADRARFFACLLRAGRPRRAVSAFVVFMLCTALAQVCVDRTATLDQGALRAYGFVIADVPSGQYWRLLTGPFVHSSLAHFLANVSFGTLGFGMGAAVFRTYRLVFVFMLGCVVSFGAELHWSHYEAVTGVSGGLCALMGLLIAADTARRRLLPAGMAAPLVGTVALAVPVSMLAGSHVAHVAHAAGFMTGVVAGAWIAFRTTRAR